MAFNGPYRSDRILAHPKSKISVACKNLDVLPILGLDPGVTTGWSLLVLPRFVKGTEFFSVPFDIGLESKFIWTHGEIDCLDEDLGVFALHKLCNIYPSAAVVVEDFILRDFRREKSRNLLSPVRVTAKLEHYLWRTNRKMLLQQPSLAKTTVTDDRLKLWGCYVSKGGQQHARDADRHVLTFLRRCYGAQGFSIRSIGWPHIYNNGAFDLYGQSPSAEKRHKAKEAVNEISDK